MIKFIAIIFSLLISTEAANATVIASISVGYDFQCLGGCTLDGQDFISVSASATANEQEFVTDTVTRSIEFTVTIPTGAVAWFEGPISVNIPSLDPSFNSLTEGANVGFSYSILVNGVPESLLEVTHGCGTLAQNGSGPFDCQFYNDIVGIFPSFPSGTSTIDLNLSAFAETSSVPEPASFLIFLSAFLAFFGVAARRTRSIF